ncbi:leucine rich repeat domain-containing protein [Phthorimaea operculella]|nr:leucine rich repeat domain-containing protein [Phthorimaea operculella]
MLIQQTVAKRLDCRTFNQIIVFVIFYCYVFERPAAAEMPHECAYRSPETETSENNVLFCKIRTISSLDHLLQNISRTHFDDVISLHVQCSEILFFESTLTAQTEKTSGKHANLAKLRELVVDKCKIRQIPARAFENFKDLKRLHVTTHNSEWSAMTMEIHEQAFAGLNELIELDLSDNNIWSTKTETFCLLYSLKTLNLTRNHLQNLKTIGFSDTLREQNLSTPTLRYTTMPVPNDACSKQNFTNSLQYCKRVDGESSQSESSPSSENNTYGEGNNSNNSYMSIDNRTCPRFNYDLRLSPSSGHVYSRVDDVSPTVPRSMTGSTSGRGRTYFV